MSISQDAQERINQYAKKRVVSTLINDMVSEAPAPQESIQSTGNTDDANLADNTIHTDNTGHTHTAGYFCGGGHKKFLSGGWADTFAGSMAGLMIGIGLGKIVNAVLHITCNK